jgi:ribosomal protein L37AE/L43A
MENVFPLAEYRKRRAERETPARTSAQYFCTRCEGGEFKLLSTGKILCVRCGALMRNISVTS